jgi:molybdenum cofactor cytidylyltransferase
MENTFSVDALIVAAGNSSRCSGYKPLYRWRDKYLITHIIEKSAEFCEQVIVITGHNAELLESSVTASCPFDVLSKVTFVHNRNYRQGMFSSLQAGCAALSGTSWAFYQFTDQPALPLAFFGEFMAQISDGVDWIQPVFDGKKGHPLLLSPKMQRLIIKARHHETLKEIGHNPAIIKKYWECQYPEIHIDIDTDEAWNEFLKQYP